MLIINAFLKAVRDVLAKYTQRKPSNQKSKIWIIGCQMLPDRAGKKIFRKDLLTVT